MREIPEKIDSKFRFVLLSASRAEQLMRGAEPKLASNEKHTSLAMEEVHRDLLTWDYGFAEPPMGEDDEAELAAADGGEAAAEDG